jgi:hypothetical protein
MDFPVRMGAARSGLNSGVTDLYQEYKLAKAASTSVVNQNNAIQGELNQLKSRLENIKQEGDKYDREFLDYSADKGDIFAKWGIRTKNEWVLFTFFIAYIFMCISFIMFNPGMLGAYDLGIMGVYSNSSIYIKIIGSIVGGVMISAVLLRFL